MICGLYLRFLGIGFLCFIASQQSIVASPTVIHDDFLETSVKIEQSKNFLANVMKNYWSQEREVKFDLFTHNNLEDHYRLEAGNSTNLKKSPMRQNITTKIIIYGWLDRADSFWVNNFRRKYLATGDYNVIVVDWNSIAWRQNISPINSTTMIGEKVADLIKFLDSNNYITLENVHILGHSLGAHIAGFVGSAVEGKIGRITGMDPAGPLFKFPSLRVPDERLDPSDAQFVDVIHTCGGNVGFAGALGHVDFYPNGGVSPQPGCSKMAAILCSHIRAHQLMLKSIISSNAFIAIKCGNWIDYTSYKCTNAPTTIMGENVDLNARGSFFLETKNFFPRKHSIPRPFETEMVEVDSAH